MSNRIPREKAVFVEALEIADPEQRRQFLDQACGADQTLRQQVEKLLALSQSAGDFFKDCAPALEPVAADAAQVLSAAESALEPEIPETKCIGPYKLLQKLGEGGYGVVYMAEQEQPIRRRVALKIIKLGMDTRNVIARFEADRQALALMDHPNIARVLDAGATETGRPYFVMELVYGVKITEYCDQNRVSMRERLQLFIQVCNAVQHAHQKGIIHRDLKPSNIMVTMHDGVPFPKVIDFGIAKATEQRLTDKTLFTSYAQLMGTPAYMSPEQMELSGLNLDTRSDIYSLGVLLYELLTGRTPFDTTDLLKLGVEELRRTVREQEPLSPSAKLQTLNNEEITKTAQRRHIEPPRLLTQLRGDLDWSVLKCLEKDRTRRYATANGLAMDIERYLHEEAVLARPPSRLYRLQKLVRRNRMVFLFGAAAAAALLLGTITSTLLWFSEARQRKEAELREKASRVASFVTQGRFDEADKLEAALPVNKPSIEVSAELRALGDWHAANGRWADAAARFASVVKVNQFEAADLMFEDALKLAVAFLKSGNRPAYEEFRSTEVARLGLTNISAEHRIFKLGLLLPPDASTLQLLSLGGELVEKRFPSENEMRPGAPRSAEWLVVLGLWEYRRGNFSRAAYWCDRCQRHPAYSAARIATTFAIQGMLNWRLGYYQLAVVNWAAASELIQAKSQQGLDFGSAPSSLFPGTTDQLEGPWEDWIFADVLRRECDELIAQSERTLNSMSQSNRPPGTGPDLYRALGEWHAIRAEWEQARNRFEDVRRLAPSGIGGEAVASLHTALALLKLGDEAGFASLREEIINRIKDTTDLNTAGWLVKTVLLRPVDANSAAALDPWAQALGRAAAAARPFKEGVNTPEAGNLWLLALLDYRRGNYAKALDCCRECLVGCPYLPMPSAAAHIILAMSWQKLGDQAAARQELDRARARVETGQESGFDSWNWRDWVIVRLLLAEAEDLVSQPALSIPQK